MKVLLVGYFTGHHAENSILDSLKQLKVETYALNVDDYFKISLLNRIINRFRKVPVYFDVMALNKELLKKAQVVKPDFILFTKPIYITPKTVIELKKKFKLYSWNFDHVDFPKNFSVHFYKSISFYDCHISSNANSAQALQRYGAKNSIVIPMTIDRNYFHTVKITEAQREQLKSDIVFVGNYVKEMRAEYCEKLCKDGYDIRVYGYGWEKLGRKSCLVKNKRIVSQLLGYEGMPKVFQSSKIALAFVRGHNNEMTGFRTFEIPLCGAFMLHVRTDTIGDFYEEGKEAEFFSSYEELKNKIDKYLHDDELRKKIASAGNERINKSNYFIIDHVKKFLELYSNNEL